MKTFMEEYGLIVVAAIVILCMVVFATPIGNQLKDGVKNVITEFDEEAQGVMDNMNADTSIDGSFGGGSEESGELNAAGFYFNETYSAWSSGTPLPAGMNSFKFKEDGTVDWFIDGNLYQTLPYEADENGFGIPALNGTTTGTNGGNSIYIPEYDKYLVKGSGYVTEGDYTYTFDGDSWDITFNGVGRPENTNWKTEIDGFETHVVQDDGRIFYLIEDKNGDVYLYDATNGEWFN